MKNFKIVSILIVTLFFLNQIGISNAQNVTDKLAKAQYADPNGYFKIVPPKGWKIQNFPQDSRGKVAFFGPSGTELRVLAKGLEYDSFEEMLSEIRDIEKQIRTDTNIERSSHLGIPAVKRNFTFKGKKIFFIDFMIGNTTHNLMYSASPGTYDKYLAVARESIDTYEPVLRNVSSQEVKQHAVAKSLRLSQLFFENGNLDLALEYLEAGLTIEPENTELLTLKEKILKRK